MWIMTVYGFYSIASANKPGTNQIDFETVMVRARSRQHLVNLQDRFEHLRNRPIVEMRNRDYGFRIICPKADWATALGEMAMEQDWSNFKNEVAKNIATVGAKYEHALHRVWNVMLDIQPLGVGLYNQPRWWEDRWATESGRPQQLTGYEQDEDFLTAGEQFTSGFQPPSKRARRVMRRNQLAQLCICGHARSSHRVADGVNVGRCLMCNECAVFEVDGNAGPAPEADLTPSTSVVDSEDLHENEVTTNGTGQEKGDA